MSEKKFVVETVEITDCDTDVSRIVKVITDKEECYSYEDLCDIAVLLNGKEATIQRLEKENQRVYGIIEDGGVLLTRKQLLDVIGEDKVDMFFREQATIQSLKEENEQLKKEYKIAINEMVTDYKKLEKENEQLRILLKDIYVNDELRKLAERYGVENE